MLLPRHAGWAGLSVVLVVLLALRHTEVIGPGRSSAPSTPQEDALFRNTTGLEINPPEGASCQRAAGLPLQHELVHRHNSTAARWSWGHTSLALALEAELGSAVTSRTSNVTWGCTHLDLVEPCHMAPGLPAAPDMLSIAASRVIA